MDCKEKLFQRFGVNENPIVRRRQINQHNIDCYTSGTASKFCQGLTHCHNRRPLYDHELSCNRCDHRDDMEDFPERAFIGYTIQLAETFQ